MSPAMKKLSIVVPVYFEEECIDQFIREMRAVLDSLPISYEFIFVDDGSADRTVDLIRTHADVDSRVKLVELSYNHGKQAAVTAGISYSTGDYLLYMDPDLQDPPVEIPRFISKIEEGYDLVFGVRSEKRDSWSNVLLSEIFWNVLRKFTSLRIPTGLAVMRLFNRAFAERFMLYGEQNRFIEGIFLHIGMRQATLLITQRERFAGRSKFNFMKKMALAFDAILDFSELPLRMAIRAGLALSALGLTTMIGIVALKLTVVDFQAGWPSLFSVLLTGFGVQTFFLGVVALYVGRIYRETKQRPLFAVKGLINLDVQSFPTAFGSHSRSVRC